MAGIKRQHRPDGILSDAAQREDVLDQHRTAQHEAIEDADQVSDGAMAARSA